MAPLDPDLADEGRLPPTPASRQNRPIPASSSGDQPQDRAATNRPIPLKPRPGNSLPAAYDDDEDDEDEGAENDLKDILRHAPAWLVSTVFHMLLLIVLGLFAVNNKLKPADLEVEVGYTDPLEQFGTQLEDPSVLLSDATKLENTDDEKVITPKDLAPVDDPLAAPLEIADLNLGAGVLQPPIGPQVIEGAPIGLALKGRQAGTRTVLLGKYGGTAKTEAAVEAGLAWLAKQQRPDGLWSLTGPYKDGAGNGENTVAATAMALLAFQGHGNTNQEGKYAQTVARGWRALLKLQTKSGLFSGTLASRNELLYAHAQAAIALCEIYAMTQDQAYRNPAQRAINYAVEVQDPKYGGWRYQPREDSDTSVTGWFVMALQSARMGGLKVPQETLERVGEYLDRAAIDGGRRYGYWMTNQPSNAVTAEGLLCRQYLGWRQDDPRLVEGVSALNRVPVEYFELDLTFQKPPKPGEQDVYYWYYATQATHHMEGEIWDTWNKVMREQVPAHQVKTGPEAGSWDPQGDQWGSAGGRLFVTCLSIYILEVYYRHLPIYSGYRSFVGTDGGDDKKPADAKPSETKPADATDDAADGKSPEPPEKPADAGSKDPPNDEAQESGKTGRFDKKTNSRGPATATSARSA